MAHLFCESRSDTDQTSAFWILDTDDVRPVEGTIDGESHRIVFSEPLSAEVEEFLEVARGLGTDETVRVDVVEMRRIISLLLKEGGNFMQKIVRHSSPAGVVEEFNDGNDDEDLAGGMLQELEDVPDGDLAEMAVADLMTATCQLIMQGMRRQKNVMIASN